MKVSVVPAFLTIKKAKGIIFGGSDDGGSSTGGCGSEEDGGFG